MPITPFLVQGNFGPDVIREMSEALESLCEVLHLPATATGARGILARRVITIAQTGERSGERMRDAVLAEMKISAQDHHIGNTDGEHMPGAF